MKKTKVIDITPVENGRIQSDASLRAIVVEIADEHEAFQGMAGKIYDLAIEIENRRIKIGCLLATAKEVIGHGRWTNWLKDNVSFSADSASRFMGSARAANSAELRNLEELQEYRKVLVSWGLREAPEGHGPQEIHDAPNYFIKITKSLGTVRRIVDEAFEVRPVTEWSTDERDQLVAQLEPLVTMFCDLTGTDAKIFTAK